MHTIPKGIRIGILGAGTIAGLHAKAYAALGAEVVAVADINPQALARMKELFPKARLTASWDDVIEAADVDAVDICLINSLHAEAIRRATSAGKFIFCEKTLCVSREEAEGVLDLLKDYSKTFQIGYMKRFFPVTQKAVELLPSIGEPICARFRSFQGGKFKEDVFNDPGWTPQNGEPSQTRRFASGGMLNMAGSHMLDLLHLLLGVPQNVSASFWQPEHYDAELFATALFKMKSGASVYFECGLPPFETTGEFGDGWDEFVSIDGREGRLEIYYVRWNAPQSAAPKLRIYSRKTQTWTDVPCPIVDPFALELGAFLGHIGKSEKQVPGAYEGYVVDALIEACTESAQSGESQEIVIEPGTPKQPELAGSSR